MDIKIEYVSINDLKPNEYNPKKLTKKQEEDLKKSIIEFGVVDPIIANKAKGREGIIIGGHQRFKVLKKLGVEKVPVVWLDISDIEKEKELCLRLSKNVGEFDFSLLKNFDKDFLENVGFTSREVNRIFNIFQTIYSTKVAVPIYEPVGLDVRVEDLYDDSVCSSLLEEIKKLEIDESLKKFLMLAAYRFVKFDFRNIAEFYSKLEDEKLKQIFQKLALVIIDFDSAIEYGFVEMVNDLFSKIKEELSEE